MNLPASPKIEICLRNQIVAYIDGELSPREELELESHLAICRECVEELNEQKKLLNALDFALVEPEENFGLPEDFTRVVVTNAESKVSGLRRPQERSKALFICAALFLLVLIGLGNETGNIIQTFEKFSVQFWAVGGFILKLVHDLSIGLAVILRSLSHRVVLNPVIFLVIMLIFSTFSTYVISRFVFRPRRILKN